MMDSKKYTLLLACVVLQSSLAIARSWDGPEECKFTSKLPEPILTMGHSRDNQSVVHMSAYLETTVGDPLYLPLDIKDFKFNPLSDSGNYYLTVESNCAKLFLKVVKSGFDWKVDTIDVITNMLVRGTDICHLNDVGIVQKHGSHYKCDGHQPYVCWWKGETGLVDAVKVAFPKFEFEVFGSPEKAMNSFFTTKAEVC